MLNSHLVVFSIEQRLSGVGLIVEDLDALAATGLVQGGLGDGEQHAHLKENEDFVSFICARIACICSR